MIYSITNTTTYDNKMQKQFIENLTKIINENIIPKFGNSLIMNIEEGTFTSGEYGSYRINFYKEEKKVCYLIADLIMGEWKGFEL